MVDEEVRTLLRVYVALTLAREAAGGCARADAASPHLEAATNYQGVALRELEGLLDKIMPGDAGAAAFDCGELECAAAVM